MAGALALLVTLAIVALVPDAAVRAQDVAELKAELERLRQDVQALQAQRSEGTGETSRVALGRRVYQVACQVCHGLNGDGRGPKAQALRVRPRDFSGGIFKFRSTPYGALPTDEDLERVIREGISGTEMVSFREMLSVEQRAWVIAYLKTFSPRFREQQASGAGAPQAVPLPTERPFPPSEVSAAKGRLLFVSKGCSACHGAGGAGDGVAADALQDVWGDPIRPWDFERGFYKSGRRDLDLFRTLTTGVGGTPMASYAALTSEEERWQLVDYIRSVGSDRSGFWFTLFVEEPTGVVYERD